MRIEDCLATEPHHRSLRGLTGVVPEPSPPFGEGRRAVQTRDVDAGIRRQAGGIGGGGGERQKGGHGNDGRQGGQRSRGGQATSAARGFNMVVSSSYASRSLGVIPRTAGSKFGWCFRPTR